MNTDYKSNANSQEATTVASGSPVMLALSTFKHADRAIDAALRKASQCKKLIIVYGRDVNLGLYFMESGVGLYPDMKEQCEKELLADYEQRWKQKVEAIANRARAPGIQVVTYVHSGRFTSFCLEVIAKEKPSLIITARSHRPDWVRSLFGSVADRLASQTSCPVIEA
jgi:nucleotide-binding universal stress UspA family protein